MIGTIAATLGKVEVDGEGERQGDAPICVVEAGTGTGKTLAYLLATLPIARALGKTVVVATGTVSLQSQLVDKDIPELLAATGWHYRFALAKGRGRYLCNIKLEQCLDAAGARDAGMFLFEDEIGFNPDRHTLALIKDLGAALDAGDWDGDRDSWPDAIPDASWRALTVDRRQCAGHRCRKINQCSFFQARATLEDADCIIANHDLVMADLALGGGVILPAPGDTIYVFDEAHRLADITLRHFGAAGQHPVGRTGPQGPRHRPQGRHRGPGHRPSTGPRQPRRGRCPPGAAPVRAPVARPAGRTARSGGGSLPLSRRRRGGAQPRPGAAPRRGFHRPRQPPLGPRRGAGKGPRQPPSPPAPGGFGATVPGRRQLARPGRGG